MLILTHVSVSIVDKDVAGFVKSKLNKTSLAAQENVFCFKIIITFIHLLID